MTESNSTDVNIYLFDGFETLDIFGPIEVLSRVDSFNVKYYSESGGIIVSAQNTEIITKTINECNEKGIFVIPGGRGTRPLVNNEEEKKIIKKYAQSSSYCLSICTGSAVLAKCGVLDGHKATSNKKALDWVMSCGENVDWVKKARWCVDKKYYTASGVSAGIDMSLGFVANLFGIEKAEEIADKMEYIWNKDAYNDPFASEL